MATPIGNLSASNFSFTSWFYMCDKLRTLLERLIQADDVARVKGLLDDPQVNIAELDSNFFVTPRSPMLLSLCKDNLECARLVMAAGARPDHANEVGESALHVAARQKDTSFLKLLLQADELRIYESQSNNYESPFCTAIKCKNYRAMKLFFDKQKCRNPVYLVTKMLADGFIKLDNYKQCVKLLLFWLEEDDLQSCEEEGSLLHILIHRGVGVEMVEYLISKGAKPDAPTSSLNEEFSTPLHSASKKQNQIAILKAMLEVPNVDVDVRDFSGKRPITIAAAQGNLAAVEALLAKGACIHKEGEITPLHAAARAGEVAIVRVLLQKGADIEAQPAEKREVYTPLIAAVWSGNRKVIKELLENGAQPIDYRGQPLICWIAQGLEMPLEQPREGEARHIKMMKCLLTYDPSSVNSTMPEGDTPLHLAAFEGDLGMVALLLQYGANPLANNENGETPIDLAERRAEELQENSESKELLALLRKGTHNSNRSVSGKDLGMDDLFSRIDKMLARKPLEQRCPPPKQQKNVEEHLKGILSMRNGRLT